MFKVCHLVLAVWCVVAPRAGADNAPAPSGMIQVPAGLYTPLFRTEREPKGIAVEAFWLDVLPVTQGEYLDFVRAHPQWRRSLVRRLFADEDYLRDWFGDLEPGPGIDPQAPVTFVSWFAAKAYAQAKGKRLPTTAEWEYVASTSPTRLDGKKDPAFIRQIQTWYATPSPEKLGKVGQQPPNFLGARDLHGLIWEWVADFNNAMVSGDARGDTGLDRQLFCGSGSEGAKDRDNFPAFMRYGFRSSLKASYTVHNLGFRCARNIPSE